MRASPEMLSLCYIVCNTFSLSLPVLVVSPRLMSRDSKREERCKVVLSTVSSTPVQYKTRGCSLFFGLGFHHFECRIGAAGRDGQVTKRENRGEDFADLRHNNAV